jgi:hypothetical protein
VKVLLGEYFEDEPPGLEEVEFEGREIDSWEGVPESIDPNDQFSVTWRLYEGPDGYRVYELLSPLSPGQPYVANLYPVVGHWGYGTYTEEEAREKWGQYFESLST